ncbi:MAG: hypothetical protein SGCHY_002038, partial [Lobulomycetales sp.]
MTVKPLHRKRKELRNALESGEELVAHVAENKFYHQILDSTAAELVEDITETRIYTSRLVMEVFLHRAFQSHREVKCCTLFLTDRALRKADFLDNEFARTGIPTGRLHGVPVSAKDPLDIKGYDSTSGYSKFAFKPAENTNTLLDILESEGAIVFCKTNIPQTMWTFECASIMLDTRTLNPHNHNYTPGGSSGGEAALIASRGSILGVGTDAGGSLRIPAHFCGIYALKPTYGRIPQRFATTGHDGQEAILGVSGPMARSIGDLAIFMQVVLDAKAY